MKGPEPVVPNRRGGLAKAPGSLSPKRVRLEIAKHGRAPATGAGCVAASCAAAERSRDDASANRSRLRQSVANQSCLRQSVANRRRRVAIQRVPRRVSRVSREPDRPRDSPRRVDATTHGRVRQRRPDKSAILPEGIDELVEGVEPLADGGGVREGLEDPLAEPPATGGGDGGVEKVQERAVDVAVVAANEVEGGHRGGVESDDVWSASLAEPPGTPTVRFRVQG